MPCAQLVRHGADVNAADPRGGQTALMWAAAEGHGDVVAGLIETGRERQRRVEDRFHAARLRRRSRTTSASIKSAARGGRQSERRAAIRRQAADRRDAIPAHWRRRWRCSRAAPTSTCAIAPGNTTLHLAAQVGDMSLVRALLAKGADPNVRTPKSTAPAGARGGGGGGRGGAGRASRRR